MNDTKTGKLKAYINGSIGRKIFIYMVVFAVLITFIIGIATKFFLPSYYLKEQNNYIEATERAVILSYNEGDMDGVVSHLEMAETELGGELYYFSETSGVQGYGMGKGKNRVANSNSEKFQPNGDITIYSYENKIGFDIKVIGVLIEDNYLIYEVGIQSLNRATSTMMEFLIILLAITLVLAIVVSFTLSRNIAKPIKALNHLAASMKTKDIEPYVVANDLDEIGQLNQTLNELYEELRGNIYKLNAELSKEKNAENLKKRFLAQATHELKTPIAVIRGYAEILYDGMYKDEEERDLFLKHIYDETEAVSHLILDVLDYTKMETGNYQLNMADVTVQDQVMPVLNRYRDYVEGNDLEFIFHSDIPDGYKKIMDLDRFSQIYKNLISNAVEHGKSNVETKLTVMGSKLKLSVYNDGSPIDDEDLSNVFESFYKKKGKKTGTGLGLAIVKEIVLLHQGDYRVENKKDGVIFVITI